MTAAVLCALVSTAAARPPAFSELTLDEAKAAAAEQDRVIVIVRHDPMSLDNEIMRQHIWTDPEIEAWMAEHAIGVWMTPEEEDASQIRSPRIGAVDYRGVLIGYPLVPRVSSETVLRWLKDPRDRRQQFHHTDDAWFAARSMFHAVASGGVPADDKAADLCVEMWKALPAVSHGFWSSFPEFYATDSFLGATRMIAEEHPRVLDELIDLRDRLEAGLANERNVVDRWHWMLLNAEALGDGERVVRWVEQVQDDQAHFVETMALSRLIVYCLDQEQQWALMYGFLAEPWLEEGAINDARRLRIMSKRLNAAVGRLEDANDDPDRLQERLQSELDRALLFERRLHVGAVASEDFVFAAQQLEMMRFLGPHKAEATGHLVAFAGAHGLAHPLHLPFINYERGDHREIAASIRREWPDADEIAQRLYGQADRERAAPAEEREGRP